MSTGDIGDLGRPPRILSLDGGGIRGKSSLLILENIMERIRKLEGLNEVPRPCEYFDLIGGTSTGGIIATMLGRLGMTVNECIQAYDKVGQAAFTPKRLGISLPGPPRGAFSATALEGAIKQVVSDHCPECSRDAKPCTHVDLPFRDRTCTKTVVLAITKANVDARPTLFTTYDTSTGFRDCAIWQIARATSAATTFFKSIQLGRDQIEFIDAGFGYNNPTEVLIEEAEKQFPGQQLRVLSIGTGLGSVVAIEDSRRSIIQSLTKMASESTRVASRLENKDNDRGHYYRFNVERGLDDVTLSDYEKTSKIAGHTRNYLADKDRAIQKFVGSFFGNAGACAEALSELDRVRKPVYYSLPFDRNQNFVGRDTVLQDLQQKAFGPQECLRLAIAGLGGVGKTQVALQFAFWVKQNYPEYSLFWVSALSDKTFRQGYLDIGKKVDPPIDDNVKPKTKVKKYLMSTASGKWLLIIDNLDDGTVWKNINAYLPQSKNGIVFFTTRSLDVAASAAGTDVIKLDQMKPGEAKKLLGTSLSRQVLIQRDEASAMELLEKLTYLPLAIAQAAAYLNRNSHRSIRDYLELLHGTDQEVLSALSQEFPDRTRYKGSRNAVATTWLVSFDRIREIDTGATEMLSFLSCIEPKAIPQSLLPQMGSKENQERSLGVLVGFAFLGKRGDEDKSSIAHDNSHDGFYDMHSLVHLSLSDWVGKFSPPEEALKSAIQHMTTIFAIGKDASPRVWRSYFPHCIRLLEQSKAQNVDTRFALCDRVGLRLFNDVQPKEAIRWWEDFFEWTQKTLGKDDRTRVQSEHNLACAYIEHQRHKDAIPLLEHVVECRKTLRKKDPVRLKSETMLGIAYLNDARVKDAIRTLKHVVKCRETLREGDFDRLQSKTMLAAAYIGDGQVTTAIPILKHTIEIQKALPEEDRSRLFSEQQLGKAYLAVGQVKDAIPILEQNVIIHEKTSRQENYQRINSETMLATAYLHDRRLNDGRRMLGRVVKVLEKAAREENRPILDTEQTLGETFTEVGRLKHWVWLLESVEHATAHFQNKRPQDAITLLEHVIEKGPQAEDDALRLGAQYELAVAYSQDKRIEDAIGLLEHIMKKGSQAENDIIRLATQSFLGSVYVENGRIEDGIRLLKRTLKEGPKAEDNILRLDTRYWLQDAHLKKGKGASGLLWNNFWRFHPKS